MNLEAPTAAQWAEIGNALKLLWIALALAVTGAGAWVTAHAIIPSAADSGTIPVGFRKLRPFLYLTGGLAVAGIAVAVIFIIDFVTVIREIYPRLFF